jgi:hypothetical protein
MDVTIDFLRPGDPSFLNPKHVANPGNIDEMMPVANQYLGAFCEIIVEHVGNGFHDAGMPEEKSFLSCVPAKYSQVCYDYLFRLLKIYQQMLSPGGTLIYRGERYSFTDQSMKQDLGRDQSLNMSRMALAKMMGWGRAYDELSSDQIQQYLQDFYTQLLMNLFTSVTVDVKKDESYRQHNESLFPYYYIEITAIKK